MKTSAPRMFSSIWNDTSLSGNRRSRAWPSGMPSTSAISRDSCGFALPEKIFRSPKPVATSPSPLRGRFITDRSTAAQPLRRNSAAAPRVAARRASAPRNCNQIRLDCVFRVEPDLVGAGGFEPPNTGSKVPRLTAWPRPTTRRASRRARAASANPKCSRDLRGPAQALSVDETCGSGKRRLR